MVTSFFSPFFFSLSSPCPFSPWNVVLLCAVIACHSLVMMSRHMAYCCDKYHAQLPFHVAMVSMLPHSSVCLLIWFSLRKFPWCTVLRQPLCPQQQHLPQVFPSLQQPQPTRFANLQLCFLQTNSNRAQSNSPYARGFPIEVSGNRVYVRAVVGALIAWGFKDTSCWPTHSLYDEPQNAFLPFVKCSRVVAAPFLKLLKWYLHKQFSFGLQPTIQVFRPIKTVANF